MRKLVKEASGRWGGLRSHFGHLCPHSKQTGACRAVLCTLAHLHRGLPVWPQPERAELSVEGRQIKASRHPDRPTPIDWSQSATGKHRQAARTPICPLQLCPKPSPPVRLSNIQQTILCCPHVQLRSWGTPEGSCMPEHRSANSHL